MDTLREITENLKAGDADEVLRLTREALGAGMVPKEILDMGFIAGMNKVGELFKNREIFLPDVLLAAKAMQAGMEELKPLLAVGGVPALGKVVLGTVSGDLHDIGKNLVGIMLKGAGFEVIDLGTDVPPERFVEAARSSGAGIIGLSALLTTTMPVMGRVVERLKDEKLYGTVKVIVGGAPVSGEFAREIGAHAYGYDAASAVEIVKGILG